MTDERREAEELKAAMRENYRGLHMAVRRWVIGVSRGQLSAEGIVDDAHRLVERTQAMLREHAAWSVDGEASTLDQREQSLLKDYEKVYPSWLLEKLERNKETAFRLERKGLVEVEVKTIRVRLLKKPTAEPAA